MYMIQVCHHCHGNSYFFRNFEINDGVYIPRGVMAYRAGKYAAKFRSIKDACTVSRLIDRSKYRAIIVPLIESAPFMSGVKMNM